VENAKPCVELNAQFEPDVPGFTGAQGLFEYLSKFMKTHTLNQIESHRFQPVKNMPNLLKRTLALAGALAVMSGLSARASSIVKANNSDNLNLTTSWSGGVVPGSGDIARWDSTVSGANTVSMGTNLAWSGIQIVNPGGLVTIQSGNTLTNGAGGIDMSAATQSLTLSNNLVVGAPQFWTLAAGVSNTVGGALSRTSGGVIRLIMPDDGTAGVFLTNGTANTLLGSTFGNNFFGTLNSTDYVAEVANGSLLQAVGGSTVSGLYTNNPNANPPSDGGAATLTDFINNSAVGAYGLRLGNNRVDPGFRFNVTQTNTAVTYNGLPAWQVNGGTGSRVLTINSILVTPNCASPILFNGSGTSSVRIGSGGTQDFLIYQNSPSALIVFQNSVTMSQQGTGNLVKLGAGPVEIQCPTTYSGGTRVYEGTLRVSGGGGVGSGALNVLGGNFAGVGGSSIANTVITTFSSGTTNSIELNAANARFLFGSNVTFRTGTTIQFSYSNTVSASTTTAPLMVTNAGTILTVSNTVNINVLCGSLSAGQFPLIKYTGTLGGDGFSALNLATLPPHILAYLSNNVASQSIDLVVTNITQPLKWAVGDGVWDIGLTANWKDTLGSATTYQQIGSLGDNVIFDDSASGASPITVTLNTNLVPGSVTVNASKNYTITGNGSISGSGSLTKAGSGTLTLQTTNAFTGGVNLNGGIVSFTTISNLGVGAINFGGGTLQYNGNTDDISTRTVTFNAGSGTIDLNGNAVTFNNAIGNNGAGGFTLTGNNTLLINRTNNYSGNTIINSGSTLAFQSANTFINNSAALVVNGTLDAKTNANLTLSTPASQMLAGTGTVQGEIIMGSGTSISPATNGTTGTLTINGDLTVNGGTFLMDIVGPSGSTKDLLAINSTGFGSGNLTLGSGVNAGTVQLNVSGTLINGIYRLITYSGTLSGGAGNLNLTGFNQPGQLAYLSSSANANGEIDLNVISGNTNSVVWAGGNSANAWDVGVTANWMVNGGGPGYYANGNTVTFNDTGSANPAVGLTATFLPFAITLNVSNNNYTFQDNSGNGSGKLTGNTGLIINSAVTNTTTILTPNGNSGPTVINGGTLQVGNGSATGDIGTGNVTNNGTLIFDQTDNRVVAGQISGTGKVIQEGSVVLTLAANNSYAGQTIISNANSILQIGSGGAAGSLGAGSVIDNGMLIFNRSGSVTVPNNISGSGALTKLGSSTMTFTGSLTYQGNTYISNGVVKLTASEQIPDGNNVSGSTGWLILDGGSTAGTFDLGGFNETINALSGVAGTVNGLITNTANTGTNTLTVLGAAGTTYNGVINENTNGAKIQLVMLGANELRLNGANTYSGGTLVGGGAIIGVGPGGAVGTGSIVLSNGATFFLHNQGGTSVFPNNAVTIPDNSAGTFNSSQLGNGYSGTVTGSATATNLITGLISLSANGVQQYQPFLGTVVVQSGAELRWGTGSTINNGGDNTTFDVEGTMHTRGNGTISLGALIGSGYINNPTTAGTGNYLVGAKGVDFAYAGTFSGSNNLVKVGSGTMTFNGVTNVSYGLDGLGNTTTNYIVTNMVTYVGTTTISNGTLALIAPNNFNGDPGGTSSKSAAFTLAGSTAVLDLSSAGYSPDGVTLVTNSTLTLTSPQTLTGIGTIRGSVVAPSGVTVTVGFQPNTNGVPVTGLLSITNSIELGGAVNMNISTTNVPNSGEISSPTITIDSGATLVVTNVGPAFQGGEVFHLFSGPVASAANFASITLPAISSPLSWTNKLAIDGTIAVLGSLVNTNSPHMTNTFDGTTLTLSWPATGYIGYWRLEAQTNTLAVGLSTNWVEVAGASATNKVILTVDPTQGAVFYRLIYP
jgi:autotransporter-associated beta strand protein